MRITFLIVILLITISCNRSIYYAYEKGGTYATLEFSKDKHIIYRAKSDENYKPNLGTWSKEYVYLNSQDVDEEDNDFIAIRENFILEYIIDLEEESNRSCFSTMTTDFLWNSYVKYKKVTSDSLILIWSNERYENLKKEPCFEESGITWFPPYLKRIKKIDYKKFKLPYKKKYLKTMNPKHR